MARWPSVHARLKGMKPHLPPKKDDNRPTLGKKSMRTFVRILFIYLSFYISIGSG